MKSNEKSAKDIAFEKERTKFRKEIKRLTDCLNEKQKQIDEFNQFVEEKVIIISQQEDWIRRLLEYTELSEQDMKNLIEKEKLSSEITEHLHNMQQVFKRFGMFI